MEKDPDLNIVDPILFSLFHNEYNTVEYTVISHQLHGTETPIKQRNASMYMSARDHDGSAT